MAVSAAILILLIALVFAARLPFLANTLLGEEGDFAFLVANPVATYKLSTDGTPQALAANIDGRPIFTSFQHAIVPYYIIDAGLGSLTRHLHILDRDFAGRTRAVRASYMLLFMLGSLGLLVPAASALAGSEDWARKGFAAAVPVYVLSTPLAFGASIQPQVDGTVGVLLSGLAAWLLVSAENRQAHLLLLAGLLVGIGRAEWVLALLAVVAATAILGRVLRVPTYPATVATTVGLAVGVAVSLAASLESYLESFRMTRIVNLQNVFPVARTLAVYTIPIMILAGIGAALSLRQPRSLLARRTGVIISLGTGVAIFTGFTLTGYPADGFPRHVAPALMFVAYPVMTLLLETPVERPRWRAGLGALALAGGLTVNGVHLANAYRGSLSVTSMPGRNFAQEMDAYRRTAAAAAGTNAVMLDSVSIWLYYPNISFISRDLGEEGVRAVSTAMQVTDRVRVR